MAEEGIGGPVDAALAMESYGHLAELGESEGAFRLGQLYRAGKLIPSDVLSAISYYKMAAQSGHEGARDALADIRASAERIYGNARILAERGETVAAGEAYRAAALLGHAGAAYALGDALEKTAKNNKERKEVFTYYRTAAEGGHGDGVYRLALCYSRGYGVARDFALASELLSVAARRHCKGAEEELAAIRARKHRRAARRFYSISSVLYRKGNVMEAIKFRNIAAKLGSARAMYVLGCHFEFGDGIPTDRVKAGAWYARAAQAGFDSARGDLNGGFLRERKKLILARRNQMQ
jgi:TPR repeat protein